VRDKRYFDMKSGNRRFNEKEEDKRTQCGLEKGKADGWSGRVSGFSMHRWVPQTRR
jgi:hypothetical protein